MYTKCPWYKKTLQLITEVHMLALKSIQLQSVSILLGLIKTDQITHISYSQCKIKCYKINCYPAVYSPFIFWDWISPLKQTSQWLKHARGQCL